MMKKTVTAVMGAISAIVLSGSYYASLRGTAPSSSSAPQVSITSLGSSGTQSSGSTTSSGSTSSSNTRTSPGSTPATSTAASSMKDGTYTGSTVQNPYGAVQVQITISGGRITAVNVPQYPSGGRSDEINARAVPTLVSETLGAQSARVDMVSGATFTSEGYTTSLQNALDQARA